MAKKSGGKFGALVIGTAIGTAIGMLMAKKSGEELRDDIQNVAEKAVDKSKELYEKREDIVESAKETYESFKNKRNIMEYENPEYYEKEFDIEEDIEVVDASEFEVEIPETHGETIETEEDK